MAGAILSRSLDDRKRLGLGAARARSRCIGRRRTDGRHPGPAAVIMLAAAVIARDPHGATVFVHRDDGVNAVGLTRATIVFD
jgi:hypothetical protein